MLMTAFHQPKRSNARLNEVTEEANVVISAHDRGEIDAEEAAARLAELKRRYRSVLDFVLERD